MKGLLPLKSRVEPTDEGATVVSLADDAADEMFETLSSSTARQILAALYEEPRPASELAVETDTTVQNVRYHLGNLQEADLVAPADTWYSEKGTEMTVYAPTEAAVVLTAGRESTTDRLKAAITDLLGALGLFALTSLLVQYLVGTVQPGPGGRSRGSGAMSVETADTAADAATAADGAGGGGLAAFLTEPGVVFFVGCLVALVVVAVALRWRR